MKIKIFIVLALLNVFVFVQRVEGQTEIEQKNEEQTFGKIGWKSTYDFGNYDWVIWGAEHPVLENRMVHRVWTSKTYYYQYDAGSFFLSDNSIILKSAREKGFYERQTVYFYYDYGYDAKQKVNDFRKVKQYPFRRYGNNYNYVYSDDAELVNWVKGMLKNQKSENNIPIIRVVVNTGNAFGYEYELISFNLFGYQEKDLMDFGKIQFSRPEDSRTVTTEKLDVYPTPINDNRTIKDYVDWLISNTPGYYCTTQSATADIKMIIEADGSISDLIIQDGEFYILTSGGEEEEYYRSELKGFNNWIASVLNSTKFNPGQLNGRPIRTSCCFEINYCNKYIRNINDRYSVAYNGEKYGIVEKWKGCKNGYIYDEIQVLDGIYCLAQKDGKWGLIYPSNESDVVIPIQYDKIEVISERWVSAVEFEGFYKASKDGKCTVYKGKNELFTLGPNVDVEPYFYYYDYRWKTINTTNNKVGLLDAEGKVVLQNIYDAFYAVRIEYDYFYVVKKQGKIGLIRDTTQEPGMWFDEVDLKHNNITGDKEKRISFDSSHSKINQDTKVGFWFWVKEPGQDKWSLVEILKNNRINQIIKPEFDSIISTCEVQKGKRSYNICVDPYTYKVVKLKVKK